MPEPVAVPMCTEDVDEIDIHYTAFRGSSCPETWLASLVARHNDGRLGVAATCDTAPAPHVVAIGGP